MRLPDEIEGLEEPRFVSSTPMSVQYGMLGTSVLAPAGILAWFGYCLMTGERLTALQVVFCTPLLLGFVVFATPRNWRRWVNFACDRNGIHVRNLDGSYLSKPWTDVGGFYIGYASDGDGSSKAVIAKVRMLEEEWRALLGRDPGRKLDEEGYYHFGISDGFLVLDTFFDSVERVRELGGGRPHFGGNKAPRKLNKLMLALVIVALIAGLITTAVVVHMMGLY